MYEVDIIHSLCTLPTSDINFKSVLQRASMEQIETAIQRMEQSMSGNKTRLSACEAELKRRKRGLKKNELCFTVWKIDT